MPGVVEKPIIYHCLFVYQTFGCQATTTKNKGIKSALIIMKIKSQAEIRVFMVSTSYKTPRNMMSQHWLPELSRHTNSTYRR